jgi:NAD(P)-dependent dehydrogenase (short-subunit alcohol dehydrogenase family)
MGKLEGKSVLITGQQGATLLVIARQFINEGAHVFLMGSGSPELARAFQNVQTGLTCLRGDVSDRKELDRLLAEIEREIGKLDIVVANGVAEEYPTMREILVAPDETTMNLNLTGLLSAAERALPVVRDGGSGWIAPAWIAHPNGGELYVSSLRLTFDPLINSAASRSSPSNAAQWSAVSPNRLRRSGLAPAANNRRPTSSAQRLVAPIRGVSPFFPSSRLLRKSKSAPASSNISTSGMSFPRGSVPSNNISEIKWSGGVKHNFLSPQQMSSMARDVSSARSCRRAAASRFPNCGFHIHPFLI